MQGFRDTKKSPLNIFYPNFPLKISNLNFLSQICSLTKFPTQILELFTCAWISATFSVWPVATLRCVNVFQQGRWNGPQLRCLNLTLEQTLPWGLRRSRHSQHKALSAPAYTFIIFGYRVASFAKHDGTLYKSPMTNWVKGKGMKRIFRKWK